MLSQSRKAKGRLYQQALARMIVEAFSDLAPDDVQSRSMGSSGIDIMLSPKAQALFPVSIEAKNSKSHPNSEALEQAKYNAYPGTIPIVSWKPPRKGMEEGLAILAFSDLIKLIKLLTKEK